MEYKVRNSTFRHIEFEKTEDTQWGLYRLAGVQERSGLNEYRISVRIPALKEDELLGEVCL